MLRLQSLHILFIWSLIQFIGTCDDAVIRRKVSFLDFAGKHDCSLPTALWVIQSFVGGVSLTLEGCQYVADEALKCDRYLDTSMLQSIVPTVLWAQVEFSPMRSPCALDRCCCIIPSYCQCIVSSVARRRHLRVRATRVCCQWKNTLAHMTMMSPDSCTQT